MTASPTMKRQERFTYSDYLNWPDDERWEIIEGVAYAMTPAPGIMHQRISRALQELLVPICLASDVSFLRHLLM